MSNNSSFKEKLIALHEGDRHTLAKKMTNKMSGIHNKATKMGVKSSDDPRSIKSDAQKDVKQMSNTSVSNTLKRLKDKVKKEEVALDEGDPAHWKGKTQKFYGKEPPGTIAGDKAAGKYKELAKKFPMVRTPAKPYNPPVKSEEVEQIDELYGSTLKNLGAAGYKPGASEKARRVGIKAMGKWSSNKFNKTPDEQKRDSVMSGAAADYKSGTKRNLGDSVNPFLTRYDTMIQEAEYAKKSPMMDEDAVEGKDISEMSDAQKKKREQIVRSMKKNTANFKKNYGQNWKNVMYASATKTATKEGVEFNENELMEEINKLEQE